MSVELWTSGSFRDEAQDGASQQVGLVGLRLTGEVAQPHARPWSTAIRFGTSDGPVWFDR